MSNAPATVLWVDDEVDHLRPLERLLTRAGARVDIVSSIEDAEHSLSRAGYTAVVLDVIIPFSSGGAALATDSGFELARRIRKGHYQTPSGSGGTSPYVKIIFLTAVTFNDVADKAEGLGVDYFDKTRLLEPGVLGRLIEILCTP